MNKERAREELRDRKILAEIEYNQSEDAKKKDNLLRYIKALDIAIESLDENERLKKERDYILEKAKLEKVKAELKDTEVWKDNARKENKYGFNNRYIKKYD